MIERMLKALETLVAVSSESVELSDWPELIEAIEAAEKIIEQARSATKEEAHYALTGSNEAIKEAEGE